MSDLRIDPDEVERFWAKVDKSAGESACWPWTGSIDRGGYGVLKLRAVANNRGAHRIAFRLTNGHWPVPCCCHSCDNPICVNPAHLWEGTYAENHADMRRKGRDRYRTVGFIGEEHPGARLTWDDVDAIRASGEGASALAARYGVSRSAIRSVLSYLTWKPETRPTYPVQENKA